MELTQLSLQDMQDCLQLADSRGWGLDDSTWKLVFALGAVYGIRQSGAGLVGTVSLIKHQRAAFIGMMLVHQRFAGQGLGQRLMEHALEHSAGMPVLLYATEMGRRLYSKLGFRDRTHLAILAGKLDKPFPAGDNQIRTLPFREELLAGIIRLDTRVHGYSREPALRAIARVSTAGLVIEKDGRTAGFGFIRPGKQGLIVGPLWAGDEAECRCLLAGLLGDTDQLINIYLPAAQQGLREALQGAGFGNPADISPLMIYPGDAETNRAEGIYLPGSMATG